MMIKARLSAKFAQAIGFLILCAVIFFVGPFFGLTDTAQRMMWIAGLGLLWLLTVLAGRWVARRAGRLLDRMLRRQVDAAVMDASAKQRAKIKKLRERLLAAIHTLEASKFGKTKGRAALYELPWYMIIGHSAAGKSTALLQSGLTFPFSDQNGTSVQGIGGTHNCEWFFSSEGVLLDTAGRYSTEAESGEEWLGFLGLLKRYRSRAPINGILLATSLPELLQYQTESFAVYARKIRERIHEIEDVFDLRPPVYLIFTKLDLLGGFAQFFEDATEDERARVWGATLDHEQAGEGFDVRHAVESQCELLYRGLRQIGEEKLGLARGADAKPAFYTFPLEFHALTDGICRFVELLYENDPYHAKPMLRGIYFTSAVQQGEPRIAAGARVSSQFDLSRAGFEPRQPAAAHGYFLRGLFRDVIFSDQYLITLQSRPRARRLRLAGMAVGLAALTVAAGALGVSFDGNRDLIATIDDDQARVFAAFASEPPPGKLAALARLQRHIEQLQQYRREGVPLRLGAGLYQGQKLESALRRQYFGGLRAVLLEPVREQLETVLGQWAQEAQAPGRRSEAANADPAVSGEESYEALKTYLMLASRPRLDAAYLGAQLPRLWRPWLAAQAIPVEPNDGALDGDAQGALAFYLSQVAALDEPLIDNDEALVDRARKALRATLTRQPAEERVYAGLKQRANAKFPALTVGRILGDKDDGILTGAVEVPGALTREAWDKYLKTAIAEAGRAWIESEDWVLAAGIAETMAPQGETAADLREEIEARYRADYAQAWKAFLNGLSIGDPGNIVRVEQTLARLSDPQGSPLKIVLQRTAWETAWDNPAPIARTVETAKQTVLDKAATFLQGSTRAPIPDVTLEQRKHGPLGGQFAFIAELAGTGQRPSTMLAGYLDRLGKIKARYTKIVAADEPGLEARELVEATLSSTNSEIADAMQYVDDKLPVAGDPAVREGLRSLLTKPLLNSYAALLAPIAEDLNLLWASEVYNEWKELAGKYPFGNSRDEAELPEIAAFVRPDGPLDNFVDISLGDLVIRRGNQIVPRLWHGMGVRLAPAFVTNADRLLTLSAALGRGGGLARFELQPVPTPGLSEITVEIDGQTLRYRNGPQPWHTFRWPGDAKGARITAVAFGGAPHAIFEQSGHMGLVRMLGAGARKTDPKMPRGELTWRARELGEAGEVKLNFRMVSGVNPMQLAGMQSIALPEHIAQQVKP
ncbi:MAG: type VI secretion system membrane subunit TssM [Azoarcus sp.]|jgi:type VI secretion system protein ImpL|nr:type VI secretion system membrane subunit TssM [Azoarcus sp.]